MRLNPKEPNFTASTILLGEEIAQQLIESARRARPKWVELFQEHAGAIPQLKVAAQSRLPTFHHRLVSEFILEWARNTTWGVCDSGCSDAIGVNVPSIHLERLAEFGGVEAFSFMLGDRADFCSASLGNNDHNREFGLIVNCPTWIELASHEEFQWSFDRQMHMVIQHEMAHFRYQNGGERSEIHAVEELPRPSGAIKHQLHRKNSLPSFKTTTKRYRVTMK